MKAFLTFLCTVIFSCCQDAKDWSLLDSDADSDEEIDTFSWREPPDELDLNSLIDPWDAPLPVRAFKRQTFLNERNRPKILPDGSGGVIITAPVSADCENGDELCVPVHAQRISSEGEKMWGDDGVLLTHYYELNEFEVDPFSRYSIAGDGKGGVFVVSPNDYSELKIYANRIFGDGSTHYARPEPLDLPLDEMIEERRIYPLYLEPTNIIVAESGTVFLNINVIYGFEISLFVFADADQYMTLIEDNLEVKTSKFLDRVYVNSEFFHDRFFELSGSNILNIEGDLHWTTYRFIGISGEVTGEDRLDLDYYVDFDRHAGMLYGVDCRTNTSSWCTNAYIYKLEVIEEEYRLKTHWDSDLQVNGGINRIESLAGDGRGYLVVSGCKHVKAVGYETMSQCMYHPDRCTTNLFIQWLDADGSALLSEDDRIVDSFAGESWYPNARILRSVDGDMIHVWMSPLVHTGEAMPDYFSYKMGYYLCAQRRGRDDLAQWDVESCLKVGELRAPDLSTFRSSYWKTWWYDMVEDGEGGAIVVFYAYDGSILAQRISAQGRLMWEGE